MTVDNFLKPKVLKDTYAIHALIVRLLLLEPGIIQTHPDMGVGLVSRFRYSDVSELGGLRSRIKEQIAAYLPSFQDVDVSIEPNDDNNEIEITISIEGTAFIYNFNNTTKTLKNITDD